MPSSFLTLFELNLLVKEAIKNSLDKKFWIVGEISEIRENYSGHCYMEFVQKDEHSDSLIAKAKANIWASTYRMLKPYFETTTGSSLAQGMKILVNVSVEFHELYGYSLTVSDIDPAYTIGDMEQKRAQTIKKLMDDGIFEMNQELEMPVIPQRIAILTSESAAGYGDFISQLNNNEYGFLFYPCLFKCVMQGEAAEKSILNSLERVFEHQQQFDVVVIIRGGGSRAELSCFDSYDLASHICQFPLPVIAGIGHERDQSVVDFVAHTRTKTPTATATFLIDRFLDFFSIVMDYSERIAFQAQNIVKDKTHETEMISEQLSFRAKEMTKKSKEHLVQTGYRFALSGSERFSGEFHRLLKNSDRLAFCFQNFYKEKQKNLIEMNKNLPLVIKRNISGQSNKLSSTERIVLQCIPENILKKGFSITMSEGKIVKRIKNIKEGDHLITILSDGKIDSTVNNKN